MQTKKLSQFGELGIVSCNTQDGEIWDVLRKAFPLWGSEQLKRHLDQICDWWEGLGEREIKELQHSFNEKGS